MVWDTVGVCERLTLAACEGVMVWVRPPDTVCDGDLLAVPDREGEDDRVTLTLDDELGVRVTLTVGD